MASNVANRFVMLVNKFFINLHVIYAEQPLNIRIHDYPSRWISRLKVANFRKRL